MVADVENGRARIPLRNSPQLFGKQNELVDVGQPLGRPAVGIQARPNYPSRPNRYQIDAPSCELAAETLGKQQHASLPIRAIVLNQDNAH
jgi:hypothetical protein